MDSRIETWEHIHEVQKNLSIVIRNLQDRQLFHDQSKLHSPEVEIFDQYTHLLKTTTFGSKEYEECLAKVKPALDHHYKVNRHHPNFYENGILGMSLLDLIEMLEDWKAAVKRHPDGCIFKSIEINQKRFGYSDELKQILINTVRELNL